MVKSVGIALVTPIFAVIAAPFLVFNYGVIAVDLIQSLRGKRG